MVKKLFLNMTLLGVVLTATASDIFAGFSGDFTQPGGAIYDSGFEDKGGAVVVDTSTASGPFTYVVGYASCTGNADIMVTKYDGATGTKLRSAVFYSSYPDYGRDIAVDNTGSVYVAGCAESSGYYSNAILKCGSDLVLQSSAAYADGTNFRVFGVAVSGTNVYVAGGSEKDRDGALLRYNRDLVFQSSTSLRGICEGIAVDCSGNIVAAHYASNDEAMVSRFNASLTFMSSSVITGLGTGNATVVHDVAVSGSGNIYVVGSCTGTYRTFILKFSDSLALVSSTTYDANDADQCGYGVGIDLADRVYIGGSAHNGQDVDALLLKYGSDLVLLSSHTYDAGNNEYGRGIALDQYDAVYFTGYAVNSAGNYDCRTVKRPGPSQPSLTWTGETGYAADGVDPGTGQTGPFVYRVTYTDPGNVPPANGYPIVYVAYRNESIVICSMTEADTGDTNYVDGKIYTYTYNNLPARDQSYKYLFQAKNANNLPANGPATILQTSPTVSGIFSGLFALPDGTVYNTGVHDVALAIAVDETQKQVLVAGYVSNNLTYADYCLLRYDADGRENGCVTFDRGSLDYAYGLCAFDGDTYVVGISSNGATFDGVVLNYDPYLQLRSSAAFDSGGDDIGYGVARDQAGNVFVCGGRENGSNEDAVLFKYNADLVLLSSRTYDGGGDDVFYRLAIDTANQVFISGISSHGSENDCIIFRYDNDLVFQSSAVFNSGLDNAGYDIAVDTAGRVYVAGYFSSGTDYDWFVTKYSNGLVLLASTTFNSGGWDRARGLAFDPRGNLYVSGNAGTNVVMTRLYDRDLVFRSSVTYTSGSLNSCAGVASDNDGYIYVACSSLNGNGNYDYRTIRYSSSAFIVTAPDPGTDPNPDPGPDPNPYTASCTISPDATAELVIYPASGEIRVSVPARCFTVPVTMTLSTATPHVSDQATVKLTGIGFEITVDGGVQPLKDITVTVHYRDTDITGLEGRKLAPARYDETRGRWIALPSTAYPDENRVTGRTRHLSLFALVQLAPADGLSSVTAYPNPFNPARQANMTIDNLPATAGLKIYAVTGQLIRTLDYTSATGRAYWDGNNDGGVRVASGVYLLFINSVDGDKKLKIAVQK